MKYLLVILTSLLLFSCSKSSELPTTTEVEKPAVVQSWRFACGPACDAIAWVLELPDGTRYEADNLPPPFQNEELPVLVSFHKTGKRNSGFSGTGLELVKIIQIRNK